MRDGCTSKVRLELTKVFPLRANVRDGAKGRSGGYTDGFRMSVLYMAWKFKSQ